MSNIQNEEYEVRLAGQTQQSKFSKVTEKVSAGIEQIAGFLDEKVRGMGDERESKLATAGHRTVDALNSSAAYIKTADLDQMQTDLRSVIKRNPEKSLLVGLGVGILLGSVFRKR